MKTPRLLPALLFATASLLAIKVVDIAARHELIAAAITPALASPPVAAEPEPAPEPAPPQGTQVHIPEPGDLPATEREILESLVQRREALEARAQELDLRENLLAATEERVAARIEELKALEGSVGAASDAAAEAEDAQLADLITIYESMRPKDAGRIFSGLDLDVLVEVSERMDPRKMADVLAQMTPEAAQRLTMALAMRARGGAVAAAPAAPETVAPTPVAAPDPGIDALPKIEGVPTP